MNTKNQSLPDTASRSIAAGNLDAFTLVELAVVIAIIGLLAVMLLPALAGTKGRACAANDISNIKQTMTGMLMYCNDNSNILPAPGWGLGVDCWVSAANPPVMTAHTLASYNSDYKYQVSWFTGIPLPLHAAPPRPAQLYQYLKSAQLLICPEDTILDAAHLARHEIITSYAWNGAIVAYQNGLAPFFKISRFKPTNIVQWERADDANWGDFSNSPMDYGSSGNYTYSFSTRHGKVTPVGRIDGSAASESMQNMKMWADDPNNNDLWCSPTIANGH